MKTPKIQRSVTTDEASLCGGVPDFRTGSADPHIVIRGESTNTNSQNGPESLNTKHSLIDYLSFTYHPEETDNPLEYLASILIEAFNIPQYDWQPAKSGWNGYSHRLNLGIAGFIAYGGEHQRKSIHVQLYGKGCAYVKNWEAVYTWGVSNKVKITRIDAAYDDFKGESINIIEALKWVKVGLFNSSGRPPSIRMVDDFDSGEGKTLYIGKRANGKMCRIYEKGKEQGMPESPWVRAEVEFRSKDRKLVWEMVQNPDSYLSGAYEAFKFLNLEQSRVQTTQKEKTIAFTRSLEWCRRACGQYINLLCFVYDEDIEKVIREIRRPGIPKKLLPFYQHHADSEQSVS